MLKSDCFTTKYQVISDVLLYKKLHLPKYRTFVFRVNSFNSERPSKGVLVLYDVYGKGTLYERLIYNNDNNVISSKYSYLSNKQRESDRRKNRKRLRRNTRKCTYVEDK